MADAAPMPPLLAVLHTASEQFAKGDPHQSVGELLRTAIDLAATPAPAKPERDRTNPPPGFRWFVHGDRSVSTVWVTRDASSDPVGMTMHEAWSLYDREHGYAPTPSEPQSDWSKLEAALDSMTREGVHEHLTPPCGHWEMAHGHGWGWLATGRSEPAAMPPLLAVLSTAREQAARGDPDRVVDDMLRWACEHVVASELPAGEREEVERLRQALRSIEMSLMDYRADRHACPDYRVSNAYHQAKWALGEPGNRPEDIRAALDSLQPSGMEERVREKLGLDGGGE